MVKIENYPNAYKEVYIILQNTDSDDLKLIPESFINMIKENMNNNYKFELNPNVDFEKQKLLRETKSILAYIFLNYWGTEKQKNEIKRIFRQDILEAEKEKIKKYKEDDMFRKTKKESSIEDNLQIIKYKRKNIILKFINKLLGKI